MKVTVLLCDAAEVVADKLYILGGGWSVVDAGAVRMAIAIKIEVPWDRTNQPHSLALSLVTEDGSPVTLKNEDKAEAPVAIQGQFEVGRPPRTVPGTPIDFPLTLSVGTIPLDPGRYTWRLEIDGESDPTWEVGFTARLPASGAAGS
ncbi:MAG: hypothetical protein ABI635_07800 [Actinomycetota bacterium]